MMELKQISDTHFAIESTSFELLDLVINAQHTTDGMIKALDQIHDTNTKKLLADYKRKNDEYKRLIYQLQIACGFDPTEF